MYGIVGGYFAYFNKDLWLKFKTPLFILGFSLLFLPQFFSLKAIQPQYLLIWSFTNNSLATLFLLPFLSTVKKGRGNVFKILTSISLISYSMYLVNYTLVQQWILDKMVFSVNVQLEILLKFILFWIITIIISIIIYKYFEVPTTRLRGKKIKHQLSDPKYTSITLNV